MKVRSMVGLIPLFAVETLDSELVDSLPSFKHRMQWFIENQAGLCTAFGNAVIRRRCAAISFPRESRSAEVRLAVHAG